MLRHIEQKTVLTFIFIQNITVDVNATLGKKEVFTQTMVMKDHGGYAMTRNASVLKGNFILFY